MEDIPAFFGLLLWNLATVVAGILFLVEPVIRFFWSGYDQWADQHIQFTSNARRNFRISLGILALVAGSYLVYHDTMNEVRRLQTEIVSLNKSAQLVFVTSGSGNTSENGRPNGMRLDFRNGGSLPSIGLAFKHKYMVFDHDLTASEVNSEMANVKKEADKLRDPTSDSEIQPAVTFSIQTPDQNGILYTKKEGVDFTYYLFAVLEYKDRMLPPGEWWVTEICLEMSKKGTLNCTTHNKIYQSN